MSKPLRDKHLEKRTLLAVFLSLTLVAFGCTTDRNLGNGTPVMTPGSQSAPTSGVTSGSESAPSIPPPMMSSSTYSSDAAPLPRVRSLPRAKSLPRAQSRTMHRLSPDQAAAIMAGQQHSPSVKVLGTTTPGPIVPRPSSADLVTGQFINPAMLTNPTATVNSSATSGPTAVISSGAGEVSSEGAGVFSGTTLVTPGSTAPLVSTGTTAVTPTGAAIPLPAGAFATSSTSVSPTAAGGVRLVTDANGRTVMTNTATTSSATTTSTKKD